MSLLSGRKWYNDVKRLTFDRENAQIALPRPLVTRIDFGLENRKEGSLITRNSLSIRRSSSAGYVN